MKHEQISALMDGEFDPSQARGMCARLREDDAAECWATYHLIGDVLRGEPAADAGFAKRFADRLAAEPTVFAPVVAQAAEAPAWRPALRHRPWYYAMATAASLAAVGVVGWFAIQEFSIGPALSDRAAASPAMSSALATAADSRPAAVPTARTAPGLSPYLMVHQEYSPTTAMQGVRPYVRTVADLAPAE